MEGTPDLSALLKGKLQLLKKSTTEATSANLTGGDTSQEVDRPYPVDQTVDPDPPGPTPKKKMQKKKSKKVLSGEDAAPGEEIIPLGESTDDPSKKKKKKPKRPRRDSDGRGSLAEDSSKEAPEENPKKNLKKKGSTKKAQQSPGSRDAPVTQGSPRVGEEVAICDSQEKAPSEGVLARTVSPGGPHVLPTQDQGSVPPRVSSSEGSLGKRPRIDFSDRVEFTYNEKTPLVCNPSQCAELSRQIRGSPREMPPIGDLFFKDNYVDVALASRRADGCMNVLVEKYDTALKQTMTELGASAKLARVRLGVIERLRADQERISKKTIEEKEALGVKFEGLEAALKADRAAKKDLACETAALEKANAQMEKEKAELQTKRDAVTEKLIEERQRLRDSRGQEVSRERVRVQTAMTDKLRRRIDSIRAYLARRDLFEKERNLLGQASGTRKCLGMIREEKLEITQELIDVFAQQEAEHQAEVVKLNAGPLPEDDLAFSPLVLRPRFVNEEFMATLDPYWSNKDLVSSESASQLRTPLADLGGISTGRSGQDLADAVPSREESGP
ncbi:hypothetical protein Bca4012_057952 [Brassica carinata]